MNANTCQDAIDTWPEAVALLGISVMAVLLMGMVLLFAIMALGALGGSTSERE